jgi:hypothetical protein
MGGDFFEIHTLLPDNQILKAGKSGFTKSNGIVGPVSKKVRGNCKKFI